MYESEKIDEATYFLSSMSKAKDLPDDFKYKLSAFLSAARSVLQYACKEVEGTSYQSWYDSQVRSRPLIRFFKDKRDVNIHAEPINPTQNIGIALSDVIHISDSLSIIKMDRFGNIIQKHTTSPTPIPQSQPIPPVITYKYIFPDWEGPEDVITLCQNYLSDLNTIVEDGIAKGILKRP